MKNKKLIIIALIVIAIVAILFGIYKVRTGYMYKKDGTLWDGHTNLISILKNIEDENDRKKQIDTALEQNLITDEEAQKLY